MTTPKIGLFLILQVFGPSSVSAQTRCNAIPPGVIFDFKTPASDYHLIRTGQIIPFGLYLRLDPGDRLEILGQSSFVQIQDASDTSTRYQRIDAPLCVNPGAPLPWYSDAWSALSRKLLRAQDGNSHTVSSRGPSALLSLDMYSLRVGTATVGEGLRSFALSWKGGVAPFHLTLFSPSQQVVLDESLINQHLIVKRAPIRLTTGKYEIRLTDAHETTVRGSFMVRDPIFSHQDGAEETDISRVTMIAHVLSDHPERSFDAYLWISPQVTRPLMRHLMEELAESDQAPKAVEEHQ